MDQGVRSTWQLYPTYGCRKWRNGTGFEWPAPDTAGHNFSPTLHSFRPGRTLPGHKLRRPSTTSFDDCGIEELFELCCETDADFVIRTLGSLSWMAAFAATTKCGAGAARAESSAAPVVPPLTSSSPPDPFYSAPRSDPARLAIAPASICAVRRSCRRWPDSRRRPS